MLETILAAVVAVHGVSKAVELRRRLQETGFSDPVMNCRETTRRRKYEDARRKVLDAMADATEEEKRELATLLEALNGSSESDTRSFFRLAR